MVQTDRLKPELIVICGPTASGKTELAIALAKRLETEIISADSMNIYRGLDIGTAKPTQAEQREVRHHMIDILPPTADFSVGDYRERALQCVNAVAAAHKIPIVCGGTGFYINSLLYDISYGKTAGNTEIRHRYEEMAREKGNQAVFDCLKQIDPETAEKLHPNDVKRVIRALEIYEQTGRAKSEMKDSFKPRVFYRSFSVDFLRGELYRRINSRVDRMFQEGLIEEVASLKRRGITAEMQSMQGIGYRETMRYLETGGRMEDLKEEIKMNTRRYAKRQITFFKRDPELKMLAVDSAESMAERIMEQIG